jgi:hypothetical protein
MDDEHILRLVITKMRKVKKDEYNEEAGSEE